VPAAEWQKLVDLVNTPNVTDETTDTPVSMDISGTRWVYEMVNPDD
jgi:hypothetical protein